MTNTRRDFLGAVAAPLAAAWVWPAAVRAAAAGVAEYAGSPEAAAGEEALWEPLAAAYGRDSQTAYLNSAGVGRIAASVVGAHARELEFSRAAPSRSLWMEQAPRREHVRASLAEFLGCENEEVALTRGASEGLEICQLGIDLRPGAEVLASAHEYPRMLAAFRQRERREGIALRLVPVPVPLRDPRQLVDAFAERISARTRLVLVSQVVSVTGQPLPVAEICAAARARGVPVLVDGAQAAGQMPVSIAELGCDFWAASLHKWVGAPVGSGVLVVRRQRIRELWPLMAAAPELNGDIRKFEQVGTQPLAELLAVPEALAVHSSIGAERRLARLRYLRALWTAPLASIDGLAFLTNLDTASPGSGVRSADGGGPQTEASSDRLGFPARSGPPNRDPRGKHDQPGAIATFRVAGLDSHALASWLWSRHRIIVQAVDLPDAGAGVRVAAGLDVLRADLDRFTAAVAAAAANGLH